jgi:protein SCO1/2
MNKKARAGALTTCGWMPAAMLLSLAMASGAFGDSPPSKDVKIRPQPGSQVPLDATFLDETGEPVEFGRYCGAKPVVLVLAQFLCPRLCNEVLNDLTKALRGVSPFSAGRDFQIVVVSFDTREKHGLAAAKKRSYVEEYSRPGAEAGWHFLTGDQDAIDRLKDAVGFRTIYDAKNDQFAHDSAVIVLTPGGKVSRYLFGLGYNPRDLRLALVESSEGKVGSVIDHVLLMCFHYDPATGKYSAAVLSIVRAGGVLTLLGLVGFWVASARRGRRQLILPGAE